MTVYTKSMMESLAEVRGLQEDNMDLMRKAAGGSAQNVKMKDGKLKMDAFTASAIMKVYDKVNPANKKKIETIINSGKKNQMMKLQSMAMKAIKSEYDAEIEEEVELDEGKMKEIVTDVEDAMGKVRHKVSQKGGKFIVKVSKNDEADAQKAMKNHPLYVAGKLRVVSEEVELDEGRMKELHGYIEQGKKAEWIAKKMKLDVKTIKALMGSDSSGRFISGRYKNEAYEVGTDEYREYLEKLTPGEVDEASARADAMRAMRRGKDVDPADVDDTATDADVKAASKNIMMQMRKVVSLGGKFDVEFLDKKKVKVKPAIANKFIQKYQSMRRPADKEKFQNQAMKSYKDLLQVLKSQYMAAACNGGATRMGEEVELDENKKELVKLGKEVEGLARRSSKPYGEGDENDKKDMLKVAAMLKKGDRSGVKKFAKTLDDGRRLKTFGKSLSPQEYVLDLIGEETELDEIVPAVAGAARVGAKVVGKAVKKGAKEVGRVAAHGTQKLKKKIHKATADEFNLDEALPSHLKKFFDKDGNPKSKEGKAAWERIKKIKMKGYTPKQVKMAIGVAFDKRFVQGNMTGAAKAIEKIAKGLSDFEPVANALRRANENTILDRIDRKLKERKNG